MNCKIKSGLQSLIIPLNGEYFDAIQRGEKTEEYRLCNDYWRKRLVGRDYDTIVFTRGYPRRDDDSRRMYFRYGGYSLKRITHRHFGDDPVDVFAIRFYEKPSELDMALESVGMGSVEPGIDG